MGKSCRKCGGAINPVFVFLIATGGLVGVVVLWAILKYGLDTFSKHCPRIWAAIFDTGRFKVIFSTIQIVGSISKTTGVIWPDPFASLANVFSFSVEMFNVLPVQCAFREYGHYDSLFALSLLPFCIVALIWCNHKFAVITNGKAGESCLDIPPFTWCTLTYAEAVKYTLLVIYTFLPTASLVSFSILLFLFSQY